ncbi:MAG: SusC/RagA family TonB-linked outer membrane protein [Gemmatimonadaceae bacterium]|nr:SusC/RagA family TonB-linked outer membrane protein [Gemmatimonadaceae bacterium]
MRSIWSVVALMLLGSASGAAQSVRAAPPQTSTGPVAASPRTVDPLERLVTLDVVDAPVADVVRAIDEQAGLGLAYSDRVLPSDARITIHLRRVPAKTALARVLAGTGLTVQRSSLGVLVVARPKATKTTSRTDTDTTVVGAVLARVVDSTSREPIQGAVVGVKGTALTASTNADGYALLRGVPVGVQVITARHLGYMAAERAIAVAEGDRPVRVELALRMSLTRLQEVVTTATGPRRRYELGNDITVLNADSIVATQPISSVTDLLDGRVPGLVVQRTSGAPGDPARLRLRGASSAYLSNDPIVVVDGVRIYAAQSDPRSSNLANDTRHNEHYAAPSPLDYIDPHTIETIEVLKGPSAATLYGADAANGVIVITTKKGQAGPPRWTASVERAMTTMPGQYPTMYASPYGATNGTAFCTLVSQVQSGCKPDSLVRFQTLNDPRYTIFGHGQRTAATLGVSGGVGTLTYSVNGAFSDEMGLVRLPDLELQRYRASHGNTAPPDWMRRPQRLERWSGSSRLATTLGRTGNLSLTTMLSRSDQQRSSLENQIGTLMTTYVDPVTGTYFQVTRNGPASTDALFESYAQRARDVATQFTNGASLTWRPTPWLTGTADAGLNLIERDDQLLLPNGAVPATADSVGRLATGRGTSTMSTVNVRATATAPLPWGLRLQTAVGGNYTRQSVNDFSALATGLPPGGSSIGLAGQVTGVSEARTEQATFGWYLEPTLAHKRFWLSTGIRMDGGNTFGRRTTLAGFPKMSFSYLISDEPFFPFKDIVNTLRLRVAYGHAGVEPGPGDRLRLYSAPTRQWVGGQFVDAVTLQSLGSTELRPERSRELEAGFDADLFGDRVSLAFTGYRKTRVDALMAVPVPPSVYGAGVSILRNVGEVRNTGLEVTASAQLVRTDPVTWSTQLSVSQNRNLVVSLGPGVEPFPAVGGDAGTRVAAGYPLFGRWGKLLIGYSDRDGNGRITLDELLLSDTAVYLGPQEPDFTASLHSTVSLLRGTLAVRVGLTYASGLTQSGAGVTSTFGPFSRGANDPTAPLVEQAIATGNATAPLTSAYQNSQTQTVDMLRVNSLAVAYNVPARTAARLGARALTVSLEGTNLGLFTNYRGLDPNVTGYVTGNTASDTGVLPRPRTWQVRVSASY